MYSRVIFKRRKGCAHYYRLINASRKKHDGWHTLCNSLENEVMVDCPNWSFSRERFYHNVKQILRLNNFNKIQEFFIRLFQNNLFLNNRAHQWNKDNNQNCWTCNGHIKSCMHLFVNCACTTFIFAFPTRILTKAGYLCNGTVVELFILKEYPIDSMENISLLFLWKFMYSEKFLNGIPNEKAFAHAYRDLISGEGVTNTIKTLSPLTTSLEVLTLPPSPTVTQTAMQRSRQLTGKPKKGGGST